MVIVEHRYVGSEYVWRTLFVGFAGQWGDPMDDLPADAKYDQVQRVSVLGGHTPEMEAESYSKAFEPVSELCRVVSVDSEPHPDWTPFGS